MNPIKFNSRDQTHINAVAAILLDCASKQLDWDELSAAVRSQFAVKNWMHVRRIIQRLIDQKKIVRAGDVRDDLMHELYILVNQFCSVQGPTE